MSVALKSLAARIGEHQRKFLAAGGKPKAIKYPKEWQAEAARLAAEQSLPINELATALGIGRSAAQRWCERTESAKPVAVKPIARKPKRASFLPVEVVATHDAAPEVKRRGAPVRVTLREIAVDLDPHAEGGAVSAIIAALAKVGRQEPC